MWTIIIGLIILWIIGMFFGFEGGLIHSLLVIALIIFLGDRFSRYRRLL
jgi:hypothetical protein